MTGERRAPHGVRTSGTSPGRARACAAVGALAAGWALLMLSCQWVRPALPRVSPVEPAPPGVRCPGQVRVQLSSGQAEVRAACPGGGSLHAADPGQRRFLAAGPGPWSIRSAGGHAVLDGKELPESELQVEPADGRVQVGADVYRGRLVVRAASAGTVTVFNELDPELYLCSVVGSEMYSKWPMDALMAQAVAARSHMLYKLAERGHLTLVDMAYKGVRGESDPTTLAVELTRGIVLTYRGRIMPAYFHSTCGGRTVRVERVFADDPMFPLSGVLCRWCRASRAYRWRAQLDAAQIAEALADRGVKEVSTVEPEQVSADGYVAVVSVNGTVRLSGNAFRLAVGPSLVKSARFRVARQDGAFVFEGEGYGHGVGLCQWGAYGLARAGRTWEEILLYYYPGASLKRAN